MTIQQINAALAADPQFQDLVRKARASQAATENGDPNHTGYDPNAQQAMQDYGAQFAKAHGYDPGKGGSGTGDRTNLYGDGQYHTVEDPSGFRQGIVPAMVAITAGAGGIIGSAAAGADAAAGGAEGAGGFDAASIGGTIDPELTGGMSAAVTPAGAGVPAAGSTAALTGTPSAGLGTLSKLGSILDTAGHGIGGATESAANNNLEQEKLALQVNRDNTAGTSAYETALMNRAHEEDSQRSSALRDVYRNSYASNPAASTSPFNTHPAQYSPQYLQTLADLASQGSTKLATPGQYDTNKINPLAPYKPIDPKDVQAATGTSPGAMQTLGNWLSPSLSVAGKVLNWMGK